MKRTWMLALIIAAGCSSPKQKKDEEPQLLGTPPKPSEDPFFYVARPPVEAAAEAKGTIGEVEPERATKKPKKAAKVDKVEKPTSEPKVEAPRIEYRTDPALAEELTRERAARAEGEADLALAKSKTAQFAEANDRLQSEVEEARREAEQARREAEQARREAADARRELLAARQKVEVVEKPAPKPDAINCHSCVRICPEKGQCPSDAEVVCGWGTGKRRDDAKKRATGECDGALNMMRGSGAYSRVGGQCPPATCQ